MRHPNTRFGEGCLCPPGQKINDLACQFDPLAISVFAGRTMANNANIALQSERNSVAPVDRAWIAQ